MRIELFRSRRHAWVLWLYKEKQKNGNWLIEAQVWREIL